MTGEIPVAPGVDRPTNVMFAAVHADGTRIVPPAAPDDAVLQALGHDPLSLDALIDRCGWPAPALSAHLLALELDGVVARLPGGLYQRRQAS